MKVIATIPVRLESKRFPNKMLAKFRGKTLLEHAIDNVEKLRFVDRIYVLTTDHELIEVAIKSRIMTFFADGRCATEKTYLFAKAYAADYDAILSWPADEPLINPYEICRVWEERIEDSYIAKKPPPIVTFYGFFRTKKDLKSNLSCKMVTGLKGKVLYTSRNIIPWFKSGKIDQPISLFKKHVGVFIFSKEFMENDAGRAWGSSFHADTLEGLEQNEFLDRDFPVQAYHIKHYGFGIDKKWQLKGLEKRAKKKLP